MSNTTIKNCPFCGSPAQLTEISDTYTFQYIECIGCGARSKSFQKKRFIDISPYTVQELSQSPHLRDEVQNKLNELIHNNNLNIISIWNKRSQIK